MAFPSANDLLAGKYRLVERLGAGGMGEVWLAQQEGAGGFRRKVVCKFVPPERRDDDRLALMLADEARILGLLSHPNILAPVDFVDDVDGPLLVLEYVEGCSLRTALRLARRNREVMPESLASFVGQEIARALDAAHNALDEHGQPLMLVHRDVSPDNVLLTWRGRVRLADFGVASALGNSDVTSPGAEPKGKRGYMAPEQAAGRPVGPAADFFALGRVIAEAADLNCGPALRAVLDRATAPAAADRFPSALELGQALFLASPPPPDPFGALALWLARAAPEALQPVQTAPGGPAPDPGAPRSVPPPPRQPFILDLRELGDLSDGEGPPPSLRIATPAPGVPRLFANMPSPPPPRRRAVVRVVAGVGVALALALPVAVIVAEAEGRTTLGPLHLSRYQAPRGELRVASSPPGAEVYVDGTLRGLAPLRLQLPEGKHTLRIGSPKLERWRAADVVLRENVVSVLQVDLTD